MAPGPNEVAEAKELNAKIVLSENRSISIKKLISLVYNSKFIVSNDTGPAHIASHLNKKGLVLFGSHTTAKKVSIENSNFKPLSVESLTHLSVDEVFNQIKKNLD